MSQRRLKAGGELSVLLHAGSLGAWSDARLLERFLTHRDETAFSLIVERHGRLVMGICRSVLFDPHAASDAFQNTFLLLAEKADRLVVDDSLGRWLAGTAKKVAARERDKANKRARRERAGRCLSHHPECREAGPDASDLAGIVRDELLELPEPYRSAITLHYLEGLTYEQTATAQGCRLGTIQSRLFRGKERLRKRLMRRGIQLSTAAVAGLAGEDAIAVELLPKAVPAAASAIAAGAAFLSKGGATMVLIKCSAAALVAAVCLAGGIGRASGPSSAGAEAGGGAQDKHVSGPPDGSSKTEPDKSKLKELVRDMDDLILQDERLRLRAENESLRKRITELEARINLAAPAIDANAVRGLVRDREWAVSSTANAMRNRLERLETMQKKGYVSAAEVSNAREDLRKVTEASAQLNAARATIESLLRRPEPTASSERGRDVLSAPKPESSSAKPATGPDDPWSGIQVSVKGAVRRPGSYLIRPGVRVHALLVEHCGGLAETSLEPAEITAIERAAGSIANLDDHDRAEFRELALSYLKKRKSKAGRLSIMLSRTTGEHTPPYLMPVYLEAIENGDAATDYEVKPGDRIEVGLPRETLNQPAAELPR